MAKALDILIRDKINVLKKPMYALYLDAKIAFDVVQKELLIKSLYRVQGADKSLICIDKRLSGRKTVVEWSRHLMGPIDDEQGLEQGGINSSDWPKTPPYRGSSTGCDYFRYRPSG